MSDKPPESKPHQHAAEDAGEEILVPFLGSETLDQQTLSRMPRTDDQTTAADTLKDAPEEMVCIPGYEILSVLGRGGMGVVYKVRHRQLNRIVALKMILAGGHADSQELMRFLSEAEAEAQLHHANIVQLYESGKHHGLPYFTLEYMEGGSLETRLRESTLPPHDAARLVEQLARGMQHAHDKGIIHRDLKPANILLDDDGTPKITDFGLVKRIEVGSGLTATGALLGTPSYMAPEQARGDAENVGPLADVYSLGAILYECMTGRPPFKGVTTWDTINQVCNEEPVPPRRLQPKVPRDLETVCQKALAKESRRRYQSAAEFADDLNRFLAGEPVWAKPMGRAGRVWRWCQRYPAVACLSALTFLLLATIAVVSSIAYLQTTAALTSAKQSEYDAQQAAAKERIAKTKAQDAQFETEQARQKLESTLVNMHTSFGLAAGKRGNPAQAALWFAHAALLSKRDSQSETSNRVRAKMWSRLVPQPVRTLKVLNSYIRQMQMHPSGKYVALVTDDKRCTLWDIVAEKEMPLPGKMKSIRHAAWHPAGDRLILASTAGEVRIHEFQSGKQLAELPAEGPLYSVTVSGDGTFLALGGKQLRVWNLKSGAFLPVKYQHPKGVAAISFNEKGTQLATAGLDSLARVFAVATEAEITKPLFPAVTHRRASSSWIAPVFLTEGRGLLTLDTPQQIQWRDATTSRAIRPIVYSKSSPIYSIVESPDRRYLAVSGFRDVLLWDLVKNVPARRLAGHDNSIGQAVFNATGSVLLTASIDRTARLWSIPSGKPISAPLEHPDGVSQVAFCPDGLHFLTTQKGGPVCLWQMPQDPLYAARIRLLCIRSHAALSPDGQYVAPAGNHRHSGMHESRVYALKTRRPAGPNLPVGGLLLHAVFSPDGGTLLTLSTPHPPTSNAVTMARSYEKPGKLHIWNWRSGKQIVPAWQTPSMPVGAAWHPNGKRLALLCAGGELCFLDYDYESKKLTVRTQQKTRRGTNYMLSQFVPARWVAYSPNGRFLMTTGLAPGIQVWNAANGKLYLDDPDQSFLFDFAVSADDQLLATAAHDKSTRILSLTTKKQVAKELNHPDWVFTVQFSKDNRQLLTACRDGMARLWDWRAGRLASLPFNHNDEVFSARFLPGDQWIATADRKNNITIWEAQSGKPLISPVRVTYQPYELYVAANGKYLVTNGGSRGLHVIDLNPIQKAVRGKFSNTDLLAQTELISSQSIHQDGGVTNLNSAEWFQRWDRRRQGKSLSALPAYLPKRQVARLERQWNDALHTNDWTSAKEALDGLLQINDGDSYLYGERCYVNYKLSNREESNADASKAIELGDDRFHNWFHRAVSNSGLGDYEKAIADYSEAIKRRPRYYFTYQNRSLNYERLKMWKEAAADVYMAIKLGANSTRTWEKAGLLPLVAGDAKLYRELCRLCIERNGTNTDPLTCKGVSWMLSLAPDGTDDYAGVIEQARMGETVNHFSFGRFDIQGVLLYRAGKYKDAANRLQPGSANLNIGFSPINWFVLAMAHHQLGNKGDAKRWLDQALSYSERTPDSSKERQEELNLFRTEALKQLGIDPAKFLAKAEPIPIKLEKTKIIKGKLTTLDARDYYPPTRGNYHKVYTVPLTAKNVYLIDLKAGFDTYLRIENDLKRTLAYNDDFLALSHSRLRFIPPATGTYRIVATTYTKATTGDFNLTIRHVNAAGKILQFAGELKPNGAKAPNGKYFKDYPLKLIAGQSYHIHMESKVFDTYLQILNKADKVLTFNDDAGSTRVSEIQWSPPVTGTYRIRATSFGQSEVGAYELNIYEYEQDDENADK